MRRRLYFMLPDVASARAMLDELLLARIAIRHIRFCARDGSLPADMPEVTTLQKTDIIHGAGTGMLIGGTSGLIGASLLLFFPLDVPQLRVVAMLGLIVGGAVFGSWVCARAAATIPHSRLQPFRAGIDSGQVLLMVDVPFSRVPAIEELILRRHPEISCKGMDTPVPIFS